MMDATKSRGTEMRRPARRSSQVTAGVGGTGPKGSRVKAEGAERPSREAVALIWEMAWDDNPATAPQGDEAEGA